MDKTHIKLLGKKLRQIYVAPDELPFPMRKALEALTHRPLTGDNDDLPQTRGGNGCDPVSINVETARQSE